MQHMSESVFGGLCLIVGTSQQVAIKGETTDIEEMVLRELARRNDFTNNLYMMLSGSRKGGFRLEGSDTDVILAQFFQSYQLSVTVSILPHTRYNLISL